jgi:hypothetical protein
MHDDFHGYGPLPDSGWASASNPLVRANTLSSDQLLQVSSFLDGLDESGAQFAGTVQLDGHSFVVGFDTAAEEHYIIL